MRRAGEQKNKKEQWIRRKDKGNSMINLGHSIQPAYVIQAYQELRQVLVKHHQVLWYYFGHWRALAFFL